jgi:hypothetical protein
MERVGSDGSFITGSAAVGRFRTDALERGCSTRTVPGLVAAGRLGVTQAFIR